MRTSPSVLRSLQLLQEMGLGYLRLGLPATELSGGEAQWIKLATGLQRSQWGDTLYILEIRVDALLQGVHLMKSSKIRRAELHVIWAAP